MPLRIPALFVFAPTVQQIQNRIARLPAVIVRRGVDVAAAPLAGDLGIIPTLAHLAVRHVFGEVVVYIRRLGNFDPAVFPAGTEKCAASRVSHRDAIHDQRVIVESC
jgi:fructose 1,6-bisphosphatase